MASGLGEFSRSTGRIAKFPLSFPPPRRASCSPRAKIGRLSSIPRARSQREARSIFPPLWMPRPENTAKSSPGTDSSSLKSSPGKSSFSGAPTFASKPRSPTVKLRNSSPIRWRHAVTTPCVFITSMFSWPIPATVASRKMKISTGCFI